MTTQGGMAAWWLAIGLAAAAGALVPRDSNALVGRLSASASPMSRGDHVAPWWLPPLGSGLGVAVVGHSMLLGASALAAALAVARAVAGSAARRADSRGCLVALGVLRGLAAELRGGAYPRAALVAVATGVLDRVAAAARSPVGDVPGALNAASRFPGGGALAELAAAWTVAETTGAALAGPAAQLAVSARNHESVRRELDAQLAGPRASALLLSVLPLAGVALGNALGANPTGFLLGTLAGQVVLLVGTSLAAAGVAWTELILRRAGAP